MMIEDEVACGSNGAQLSPSSDSQPARKRRRLFLDCVLIPYTSTAHLPVFSELSLRNQPIDNAKPAWTVAASKPLWRAWNKHTEDTPGSSASIPRRTSQTAGLELLEHFATSAAPSSSSSGWDMNNSTYNDDALSEPLSKNQSVANTKPAWKAATSKPLRQTSDNPNMENTSGPSTSSFPDRTIILQTARLGLPGDTVASSSSSDWGADYDANGDDEMDDLSLACNDNVGDWFTGGYSLENNGSVLPSNSAHSQPSGSDGDFYFDGDLIVDLCLDEEEDDHRWRQPQDGDDSSEARGHWDESDGDIDADLVVEQDDRWGQPQDGDDLSETRVTQSTEVVRYNGHSCQCSSDDHRAKGSTIPIGSDLQVDRVCQILIILNLAFHLHHRYLICIACQSFISLFRLLEHLKKAHPELLRDGSTRTASRDFPLVLGHIAKSFCISQSQQNIVFQEATFGGPIVGLKQAVQLFWCNKCSHGYTTSASYSSHKCTVGAMKVSPTRPWAQAPFHYLGGSSRHCEYVIVSGPSDDSAVLLPISLPSDGSRIERHIASHGADAFCSKWLIKLGWVVWRDKQISSGFSPSQLFAFATAPQYRNSPNSGLSGSPTRGEIFEWVGCRILKRLHNMIDEAILWLHSADIELRTDLTANTKSHLRDIQPNSTQKYAKVVQRTVLSLVRLRDQPQDGPKLECPQTQEEIAAIVALSNFIYSTDPWAHPVGDSNYDEALDILLHSVLESILYRTLNRTVYITCFMDLVMILLSLTELGNFVPPSCVTHLCAVSQYCSRITGLHSLRLFSLGEDHYVPFVIADDAQDNIVSNDDGPFLKRLQELRQYILPSQENDLKHTPYSHNKRIWAIAEAAAKVERTKIRLDWASNRREFDYVRPRQPRLHITLSALKKMIHNSLVTLLRNFEALLPSTVTWSDISRLPWHTLCDDGEGSFLDAKDTWDAWLRDAVESMKRAYLDESETHFKIMVRGQPSLSAFNNLLDHFDIPFQKSLVSVLADSTGISPRLSQMREYRYRSDKQERCNLDLALDSIILEGVCQKGEGRFSTEREFVVRALAPSSADILVKYLALPRQALLQIMKENNWHATSISAFTCRIFARRTSRKTASGAWDTSEISKAWHAGSSSYIGQEIGIVDKRQIDMGIYKKLFPEFIRPISRAKTALDGLADHRGTQTTDNHYGLSNQKRDPDTAEYIRGCRVSQAMFGIAEIDNHWSQSTRTSVLFCRQENEPYATAVAHPLIAEAVGFGRLPSQRVASNVKALCSEFPLLFKNEAGQRTVHLTNQILHEVVSALVWGEHGGQSASILLQRIDLDYVADTCVIILKVSDGLTNGTVSRQIDPTSKALIDRYNQFRSFVYDLLQTFKDSHPEHWLVFVHAVQGIQPNKQVYYSISELNTV